MTSTLALNWYLSSSHKPFSDKTANIWNTFKRKIQRIITQIAPEYLPFFLSMPPQMGGVLHETLKHWQKSPHIPFRYRRRFLEMKLIECLAFWQGYSDMGGQFPPQLHQRKNVLDYPFAKSTLNILSDKKQPMQITVIIPIGALSPRISEILNSTLSTLEQNPLIHQIICIFDGIQAPHNWHPLLDKLEILQIPHRSGPAHARNLGIKSCLTNDKITDILFIDSDITLPTTSLNAFLTQYQHLPGRGIACPRIIADGSTWFDLYHNLNGTLNGRYLKSHKPHHLLFGTTSCMLIPREIFQDGFGFSQEFPMAAGEDIDFCLSLYQRGVSIYPIDNVSVLHWYGTSSSESNNWIAFKERFHRYGKGEALVLKFHPDYYSLLKQTVERVL